MRAVDGIQIKNDVNEGEKALVGGLYQLSGTATFGGGNIKVQLLATDGSTWIDVTSFSITAAGTIEKYLAQGKYRLVVTTATVVYASLVRVPTE